MAKEKKTATPIVKVEKPKPVVVNTNTLMDFKGNQHSQGDKKKK